MNEQSRPMTPIGPPPGPDPVSGALNISAFGQRYAQIMMAEHHENLALWFIDIRNFRSINPKFGFLKGNLVLQIMAQTIRTELCHDLPVARLGGDRFILLTSQLDFEQAEAAIARVKKSANEQLLRLGINHVIDPCGGMYYLHESDLHNPSFQTPLDYASIAHRNAHQDPRNGLTRFTQEDLERDMRRITIEQTIDDALLDGQIEVWYQPQIDYTLGEVIGAEALARWNHPELGWVSPSEFIPILENCGRVHDLDLYVWEEACRSAGRWRSVADGKPVPISVNVSRTEMFEPGLLEHFLELQTKYDLPKGSLHLEVTENAFVEEAGRLYEVIEGMRSHDLLVEMDDFGSGLSSLNMLKDVPVDVVKLDMGFMKSAMREDRGGVVLGSVIRMLQGLDTPIIAEGVETLEQAEMLKNMGCHLMQGFHFSRPMPLADFEAFIETNRAVEQTHHREKTHSHLDDLTRVDPASSFLFNHAMGPTMFFFAEDGVSESILVNDEFYEACGLERGEFGSTQINPIAEIDPKSRSTMWRAAAEAREHGSATCRTEVLRTGRWLECVIRYLGTSARGDIYSICVIRSGKIGSEAPHIQLIQDLAWDIDMLDAVVPNSFMKCKIKNEIIISYFSPALYKEVGLSESEFIRRFHNALEELVVPEDRPELMDAIAESRRTGKSTKCEVTIHYGYGNEHRDVVALCRVDQDDEGTSWLYMLLLFMGEPYEGDANAGMTGNAAVINFEYDFVKDTLVIHAPGNEAGANDIVMLRFSRNLESLPDYMSKTSAAKIVAMISDLHQHPTAGFTDIKCDLRGIGEQRWYHVNFVCEVTDEGAAQSVRGYAQDASDQMGSVRWWRQQAEIDQLTGLLNRNAVEQNINLAMRTQGAGMMFMVDLDGFKKVNDELGHLAGDALLRDVAGALNHNFRETDVLGRYGGDEFVAFMSFVGGDPVALAERRSASIISSISQVNAACSVGVAICRDHNATFYDLLEVADEAMYQSKENGRGTYTIRAM